MPARSLSKSGIAALATAFAMVACASCHRGADEPTGRNVATSASVAVSPALSASAGTDRCVVATADAPPPPVPPGPAAGCPADPGPRTLPLVTVRFPEARAGDGEVTVRAELARRSQDTERGLMYRTSMDPEQGMLFDLGDRSVHTFWMHNTCIPLDMLFLDDDGLVVGVLENVPTLNEAPRSVPCPSTHVLEVNAGWSRRHGVRAGQHAVLPGA